MTICASTEQPLIVMVTTSVTHQNHCPWVVGSQAPSMLHRFPSHYLPVRPDTGWWITAPTGPHLGDVSLVFPCKVCRWLYADTQTNAITKNNTHAGWKATNRCPLVASLIWAYVKVNYPGVIICCSTAWYPNGVLSGRMQGEEVWPQWH